MPAASAKVIIDSELATRAVRIKLYDIFRYAMEGALLTALGTLSEDEIENLTALDEWAVALLDKTFKKLKREDIQAEYVERYKTIMGR